MRINAYKLFPLILAGFAAVSCQQAVTANNTAESNLAAAEVQTVPPSETVDGDASGPGFEITSTRDGDTSAGMPILPEDAAKATIPAQYRGRWGMVAADCTSTRGDAKGLITIGDKTIRFYESTATLRTQRPAIATSFAGLYAFTGEGQSWEKVETLTRAGDTLKRADDQGNTSYKRCA